MSPLMLTLTDRMALYDGLLDLISEVLMTPAYLERCGGAKPSQDDINRSAIEFTMDALKKDLDTFDPEELVSYLMDTLKHGCSPYGEEEVTDWIADLAETFRDEEAWKREEESMISSVPLDSELAHWRVAFSDHLRMMVYAHWGVIPSLDHVMGEDGSP